MVLYLLLINFYSNVLKHFVDQQMIKNKVNSVDGTRLCVTLMAIFMMCTI